jgi:cytoskeleton protein RodZ
MTAQKQREDEQKSHDHLDSPGRRLRVARQARGLTQQDIATQLHLSSSIVQALEDDDHDRLPGPVFVRGYLRNYARLLGLEDKAVVPAGDEQIDIDGAPLPAVAGGVKPEIRSSHFGIRLMTWVIVIALIGLLAAWWQGRLEWPNGDKVESAAPSVAPVVNEEGSLLLPQPEPDQTEVQVPPPPVEGMDSAGSYTPPAEPQDLPEPEPASESETPPEPVAGPPASVRTTEQAQLRGAPEPLPQPPVADTATADSASPTEEPETAAEEVAAQSVVFEFNGSCWVDIRDSTRTFKLFGEMQQGERHVLGGTPPYSVILGNSPMVRVTVGGEPFDVEVYSRGNVARFTLDPSVGSAQ